jgi:UDP-GlcNAc:undecaprenyl-phosphate GlcNAc-1-phosphate transferase
MNTLVFFLGLCFVLNFIFLSCAKKIYLRFKSLRRDGPPFAGGVCFWLAFILSYLLYLEVNKISISRELIWLLSFSSILLAIEFIDDLREFSLKMKLPLQLIFIFLFLIQSKKIQIYFLPFWVNYLLSFLWIMGLTNAFNLLDIKDGLCSGVSLIIALTFVVASLLCGDYILVPIFLILSGGLASFYLLNLPPARVYMGNSGSHFLGFLFASLSIHLDYATLQNIPAVLVPLLVLAFPIIDTSFLILARLRKKMIPFKKSEDHLFLRLLKRGFPLEKILIAIYLTTLSWCMAGLFLLGGRNLASLILVILSLVLTSAIIGKAIYTVPDSFLKN